METWTTSGLSGVSVGANSNMKTQLGFDSVVREEKGGARMERRRQKNGKKEDKVVYIKW